MEQASNENKNDSAVVKPIIASRKAGYSKIDLLPPKIKADIDDLVRKNWGGKRIKSAIENKWTAQQSNDILPLSLNTYHKYVLRNYEKLVAESTDLTADISDSFTDLSDLLISVVDGNRDKIKTQLNTLGRMLSVRMRDLSKRNNGQLTAQFESVLVQYFKEFRVLTEKILEYQSKVQQQTDEDYEKDLLIVFQNILNTITIVYQKIHGNNKLMEFSQGLAEELPGMKEQIKKEIEERK